VRFVTDPRLIEEILKSPLDEMPERSVEPRHRVVASVVAVIVLGIVVFGFLRGEPVDDVTGTTVAATDATDPSGSTVATSDPGADTTIAPAEAVFPEGNGRFHEMVAIGDGEMVLIGGFIALPDGSTAPFEGTWRFSVEEGTWAVEEPAIAPTPRFGHAVALHPPTGKVVVFGGGDTTPRPCPRIRFCPGPEDDQVWQYDPQTGIWEDMTPPDTEAVAWPVSRFGHRFVYEPVTERLITFGGVGVFGENFTPNFWNDTWAYDPATNTWEDLSDPDEATRPIGAVQYGLVWNEEAGRVLMFGGDGLSGVDPETLYALDPETGVWEDLGIAEPGVGPKDRWFHSMVADPQSGRTVVIGGNGSIYRIISGGTTRSNGNLDEVWTWSPAEGWVQMAPLEGDVVAAAAAGDPGSRAIVVYGGGNVWAYELAIDTWSIVWDRPDDSDA
jgi:hypothetical protein